MQASVLGGPTSVRGSLSTSGRRVGVASGRVGTQIVQAIG